MFVKMAFKSRHFEKMECPAMKENHLLVTYGRIFVIMLIAKKKKLLKKIIQEGRKNLLSKYSKRDMKQETQKLTSLENPLENLIIMFSILEPESKKPPPSPPCAKNHDQSWKPPLIPYYQKVLPQIPKYQTSPTSQTQTQKLLPCYMFDHASTSYS